MKKIVFAILMGLGILIIGGLYLTKADAPILNIKRLKLYVHSHKSFQNEIEKTISSISPKNICTAIPFSNFSEGKNLSNLYQQIFSSLKEPKIKTDFINIHFRNTQKIINKYNLEMASFKEDDLKSIFEIRIFQDDKETGNETLIKNLGKLTGGKAIKTLPNDPQIYIERAFSLFDGDTSITRVVEREGVIVYLESQVYRLYCDALMTNDVECVCLGI